ncbi:MAG: hypothetical protein JXM73_05085 [Anaerolineae bacterium]|nr:hypothetical protein [Anaerolineae bacterium]
MENRGLSSLPASHSYGTTEGVLPIAEMSGANGAYGVGACEGLDGEITIFKGKPYVTGVHDARCEAMALSWTTAKAARHSYGTAIFGTWTKHMQWRVILMARRTCTCRC